MTSLLISLLAMLRGAVRSRAALHLEILALRHQLQLLQRSRPRRLRLAKADRWLWAWLSRSWSSCRTVLVIVKPETVIAWHRQGVRLWRTRQSRRRTGRPSVPANVRNASVAQYMMRRDTPPSKTWRTFRAIHIQQITPADFFVVTDRDVPAPV